MPDYIDRFSRGFGAEAIEAELNPILNSIYDNEIEKLSLVSDSDYGNVKKFQNSEIIEVRNAMRIAHHDQSNVVVDMFEDFFNFITFSKFKKSRYGEGKACFQQRNNSYVYLGLFTNCHYDYESIEKIEDALLENSSIKEIELDERVISCAGITKLSRFIADLHRENPERELKVKIKLINEREFRKHCHAINPDFDDDRFEDPIWLRDAYTLHTYWCVGDYPNLFEVQTDLPFFVKEEYENKSKSKITLLEDFKLLGSYIKSDFKYYYGKLKEKFFKKEAVEPVEKIDSAEKKYLLQMFDSQDFSKKLAGAFLEPDLQLYDEFFKSYAKLRAKVKDGDFGERVKFRLEKFELENLDFKEKLFEANSNHPVQDFRIKNEIVEMVKNGSKKLPENVGDLSKLLDFLRDPKAFKDFEKSKESFEILEKIQNVQKQIDWSARVAGEAGKSQGIQKS